MWRGEKPLKSLNDTETSTSDRERRVEVSSDASESICAFLPYRLFNKNEAFRLHTKGVRYVSIFMGCARPLYRDAFNVTPVFVRLRHALSRRPSANLDVVYAEASQNYPAISPNCVISRRLLDRLKTNDERGYRVKNLTFLKIFSRK